MKITIEATPPQAERYACAAKFPAFVGGFGSGKSETMCTQAVLDAIVGGPGSMVACYEPSYDLVRLILIPRISQILEKWEIPYRLDKQNMIFCEMPQKMGKIILRSLNNPERIVGYESFRAHIDELDTMPTQKAREAWNKVIARNRQKVSGKHKNQTSVYTTPEGFKFVYQKWGKDPAPGYHLIRASTESNPFIEKDYIQSLRDTYPSQLIDAYINGHFVNLTSGAVYPAFKRGVQDTAERVRAGDTLHVGMDFNVGNMAACVGVFRKNALHLVHEFIGLHNTEDMISCIKEHYPEHEVIVYPDASGKNASSSTSVNDHLLLRRAGFRLRARKANPLIKDRVLSVNAAFEKGHVFINHRACAGMTDAIEQQVFNEKSGMPEKISFKDDHILDSLGYLVHAHFPIIKPMRPSLV